MGGPGPPDPGSNVSNDNENPGGATNHKQKGDFLRINKFNFGSIIINGNEFNKDVFVTNDLVEEKENSHTITKDDVDKALLNEPDFIVIGRGTNGMVEIPDEIRDIVAKNNIELIEGKTNDIIKSFNKLRNNNKIVGIFHLTC